MKEYTVITTVQITEIAKADDIALYSKKDMEYQMKRRFDADDVNITDRQIFVRDLPNTSEVVVGTPDFAVQGG